MNLKKSANNFSILVFTVMLFFSCSKELAAKTNDYIFPKGGLLIVGAPVINKDYYLIEWGFITEKKIKKWDYKYNAYVTATLFQDSLDRTDKLKAGALGFKGGFFAPTQPWIPLLFTFNIGYAKTTLHKNPFFGREDSSADKKNMFLLESGLLYRLGDFFIRPAYQISNVKYFKRNFLITTGVSY